MGVEDKGGDDDEMMIRSAQQLSISLNNRESCKSRADAFIVGIPSNVSKVDIGDNL